jgi:DNA-binding SARP family transcriptional activator
VVFERERLSWRRSARTLRETANAVLISVYLAEGNVADALHRYDGSKDLLERELGLEPTPALADLLPRRTATEVR